MRIINKLRLYMVMVGIFSILIFNIDYAVANDTEDNLTVDYNTQFGTLKVQANTLYLGQSEADFNADRIVVEILKDTQSNRVFYESFEDYQIKEGWISVSLGAVENNPFNIGEILDANINWLKITIVDAEGINPPIIITMNAVANALFSNIARETPTGNLFPSFKNNHDKFAIVNENDNTFEYISTMNVLERLDINNKEDIDKFFKVESEDEKHLVMIKNNEYEKITTLNLYHELNLNPFSLNGTMPELGPHAAHKYLQLDGDGTGFVIVNTLASLIDDAIRTTANLFVGNPSNTNEILLWNSSKGVFEAQPTENLEFVSKSSMEINYNDQTNEVSLGVWGSIDISDLKDNTDEQELTKQGNTLILSREGFGNDHSQIDLTEYTKDEQQLDLENNILSITNGQELVDLTGYLDNTDKQELTKDGNMLTLTREGDENDDSQIDLTEYTKDEQQLSFLDNTLTITNGQNSVYLGDYFDNTDVQELSLDGDNLQLVNGGDVSLTKYLDNSDAQSLSISNHKLILTRLDEQNSTVNLLTYLDNTDQQNLDLVGDELQLSGDNTPVNLSKYINTDNQDLALDDDTNTLSLSGDISAVDLSKYLDDTDNQNLELSDSTNILSLEGDATAVDLSKYLDNSDDQQLIYHEETGMISLTDGGYFNLVNIISGLDQDQQDISQFNISNDTLYIAIENANSEIYQMILYILQ